MAGTVRYTYEISKEALKLIKNGEAVLSSGGVRSVSGSLLELAKPVSRSFTDFIPGVNLASSLTGNVQMGFIQHSVNTTNTKIDGVRTVLDIMANKVDTVALNIKGMSANILNVSDQVSNVSAQVEGVSNQVSNVSAQVGGVSNQVRNVSAQVGGVSGQVSGVAGNVALLQKTMGTVAKLSWLNCALGMVNCGISVAGFKMTLGKLEEATNQIQILSNKIDREITLQIQREFLEHRINIQSDMEILQYFRVNDAKWSDIEGHASSIIGFLTDVMGRFERREIEGGLGCNIIFNLSIAFSQVIKEYSVQYYYQYGRLPSIYAEWISLIDKINSESFKEYIKRYLILDMDMTTEESYILFGSAVYAIEAKKDEFDFIKGLIQHISLEQYKNQDSLLINSIQNNKIYEVGQKVYIPLV